MLSKKIIYKFKIDYFLIVLTSIILTCILTWPFILKLNTFYPNYGDYTYGGAILWYNQHAIKTGLILNQQDYFNGFILYPLPYTLIFSDNAFVPSLIFSPIYWLTNNLIFSVNTFTVLTFILSFVSSFYAINFFIKNRLASIIGAFVYAFNPLTFSRFPLHLDLLNKYFLPLVFLYAYKFLKLPSFKNSFLFFLFFTLNALSVVYFQIFTIILLPFFAMPFFIKQFLSRNYLYFIKLIKYGLVILIFIPILLYFNLPYLEFSQKEMVKRTLEENVIFSAKIADWISSGHDSVVYKNFVKGIEKLRISDYEKKASGQINYAEHTLFLNILPIILFIIAIFSFYKLIKRKNITPEKKFWITPFLILIVITFILTFGPFSLDFSNLKLPFYYLYKINPFFQGIRVPTRFQFVFYIPFSLIVSYGAFCLFKKTKQIFVFPVFLLIMFLLLIENYHLKSYEEKPFLLQKIAQVDLDELKFLEGKKTLHLPIHLPDSAKETMYLNWAIMTKEKITNGSSGYLPSDQAVFLLGLKDDLDENLLKKLLAINLDYLIIHKDLFNKIKKEFKDEKIISKHGIKIAYDKNKILILSLKENDLNINKCSFDKDVKADFKNASASINEVNQNFYVLLLENKSNCYLPSIYMNRYKQKYFYENDFYGNKTKHVVYFKLPPVIEPYQKIILSELNNSLRVE